MSREDMERELAPLLAACRFARREPSHVMVSPGFGERAVLGVKCVTSSLLFEGEFALLFAAPKVTKC